MLDFKANTNAENEEQKPEELEINWEVEDVTAQQDEIESNKQTPEISSEQDTKPLEVEEENPAKSPVKPQTVKTTSISTPTKTKKTNFANIFIVLSLVVLLGAGAFVYMAINPQDFPFVQQLLSSLGQQEKPTQNPEPEPEEPKKVPEEPIEVVIDPEEIVEYTNPSFEFALFRRAKTKLVEPGSFNTQLDTYQIFYEGPTQEQELTGPENLHDGYMVTLTIHKDVLNQDIDQIAIEKRNRYFLSCDSSAVISNIEERTISNRTAKTFSVENCGVNYIQSFFLRGGDLFEFNQIYRGDLGIRQIYRTETDEIVELFNILNTIQPTPQNTWKEYNGKTITFKYPALLDSTCCTVKGVESNTATKRVVLADPKSLSGNNNEQFNGLAVYVDSLKPNTFEQYVENQRKLLVENYRVIIGKEPIVNEEIVTAGGQRAVWLKGYAWWGDIVLFETPKSDAVVIFVLVEVDKGAFEPTFREILTTVNIK